VARLRLRTKDLCQLSRPHLFRDTIPQSIRFITCGSIRSFIPTIILLHLHLQNLSHGQHSMKWSYNLHLHHASKPMETSYPTIIHLPLSTRIIQMPCYYYSTMRYMASNNHHAWDFKLSLHSTSVIMGVYVEDSNISISSCNSVVSELARKVEVVNKGEVRSFLGISVTRNYPQQAISIAQPGYMDPLLANYSMTNTKSASTPFEKGTNTFCNLKILALSITSLSTQDPISLLPSPNSPSSTPIPRTRTSKPRYTSFDTSNQIATTALSTDVHQQSRLPTLSATPMRISPATRTTENTTLATYLLSTAAQ
jgi:hypothetical protein